MRLAPTNVNTSGNSGTTAIDAYVEPITLTNVTIAYNTTKGLGLHNNAPLLLRNTLLASNAGGN